MRMKIKALFILNLFILIQPLYAVGNQTTPTNSNISQVEGDEDPSLPRTLLQLATNEMVGLSFVLWLAMVSAVEIYKAGSSKK